MIVGAVVIEHRHRHRWWATFVQSCPQSPNPGLFLSMERHLEIVGYPSIYRHWQLRHRFVDPVFAICIGSTAAAIRIRREQVAHNPDQPNDFASLWKKAQRMGWGYMTAYREIEKWGSGPVLKARHARTLAAIARRCWNSSKFTKCYSIPRDDAVCWPKQDTIFRPLSGQQSR